MFFKGEPRKGKPLAEAPESAVEAEENELKIESGGLGMLEDDTFNPRDKQIDIEVESKGQKRKLIISLTWPSLAENVFSSMMSMADMIMVGGLGAYAIAAVGLITQPKFIMMAAFMAMNVGTTALVAQNKGARNPEGANSALNQALIIVFAMTIVIGVVLFMTAEPLVRLLAAGGLSEQIITEALKYYKIQIYGLPTFTFTFTINAALRGAGNTRTTFYNNTVANIVNVILNYCLIGGNFGFPRMEVAGASLATVIGQFVGFIMALVVVTGHKQYVRLIIRKLRKIELKMMKRIVNIGIPSLLEQLVMRVGAIWFTTIVTSLGDDPYAAHMVAMNIQNLSLTTGMAFGTAATTLVGQSIGRKRVDLAKIYVRMTQYMGLIVSLLIAALMFFFGKSVTSLYSNDMAIIALSADMLKIIAVVNPIMNARFTFASALRGAGDARFMAVISFVGMILVRPLVGILLVNVIGMGLAGVWIALSSDFIVSFFITLGRYRRGKWTRLEI